MKRVIKILFKLLGGTLFLIALILAALWIKYDSVMSKKPGKLEVPFEALAYSQKVNPFIGTGGYPWVCGHNFPGAAVPFSMLRLSPETASIFLNKEGLNTSGYHYWDNKMLGFSHTRLSGTGATDGGHFRLVPGYGNELRKAYLNKDYIPFSHEHEIAFPGYYAVDFPDKKMRAELTTTSRTGIHRYSFSKKNPHILLDVSSTIDRRKSQGGYVKIIPEKSEIIGYITTHGTFAGRYGGAKVYFSATFNQAFDTFGVWKGKDYLPSLAEAFGDTLGVDMSFATADFPSIIEAKVGISYVSIKNAQENRRVEAAHFSFEELVAKAQQAWQEKLSLIQIEGGSEEQQMIFYTALYRSFLMPTLFNDVNGQYIGFDQQIHVADTFGYYTDLSLWDTFRTLHPLFILIAPEEQRDMLVSLVKMKEQGGYLPRWPAGNGYTGSMLGSPAAMVIAESYLKGIRDFEVETAYQGMKELASGPTKDSECSGRRGISGYLEYGYCPSETMDKAVGKTLEYAWADDATASLAKALGYEEEAKIFDAQADYYKNIWNPKTHYFQPKNTKGEFDPIKPLQLTYTDWGGKYTDDYVEGSALQWRWMVPHDPQGLIELFGSKDFFVEELTSFFEKANPDLATFSPGAYYWHGNEPDIHAAYLFNAADRPELTQKWVRWILDHKYNTTAGGLDGNDDGATLSAWYIFSSLGFYPIAGTDRYELGTPLFNKANIPIGKNRLEIITENYLPNNPYVEKILLNGKVLNRTWISHKEISDGGQLTFVMMNTALLLTK